MSAPEFVSTAVTALVVTAAALVVDVAASWGAARRRDGARPAGWITTSAYAAVLAAVGVLAATALYGMAGQGHVRRWTLLVHVAAAGVFLPALVIVAIGWSRWTLLPMIDGHAGPPPSARWRWSFWSVLLAALVTAGTMLVSMLPVLATRGLSLMIAIHAYGGLVLVIAVIIHAYCLLMAQRGRS